MLLKSVKFSLIVTFLLVQFISNAQDEKLSLKSNVSQDNIVMTWNKTTPEQEMKEDIKALAEKGITIKYSGVKRNAKNEITAIKVEYSDRKGNKGNLELNNQNPINTIKFFKQEDEIGFGEPSNSNALFGGNPFMNGFANSDEIMKQFNFGNGNPNSQSFSFSFPDENGLSKSKSEIRIQKEGKKPLVIQDGEVIEGGDDYTKEELDEIKNNNKFELSDGNGIQLNKNEFDLRDANGLENYKKQMEKMQSELEKIAPDKSPRSESFQKDMEKTKEEMLKAKDEMIKAREELEKAKKDIEKTKTKSTVKTQKA
ncbi:hypothetical protein OX283_013190 [Flavobacterium sp. SUN052]|uniref:hypothetical protein n=1 Tax=Flavobacterium sp. SUN052 TaxID=3002441 RepID=UPI00237D7FC3|nr:hypothetical protein [Flavobacterium sp. SUN052]MEC4005619.1 hypothetical protein [Flavobacterium sp. SUN052]